MKLRIDKLAGNIYSLLDINKAPYELKSEAEGRILINMELS